MVHSNSSRYKRLAFHGLLIFGTAAVSSIVFSLFWGIDRGPAWQRLSSTWSMPCIESTAAPNGAKTSSLRSIAFPLWVPSFCLAALICIRLFHKTSYEHETSDHHCSALLPAVQRKRGAVRGIVLTGLVALAALYTFSLIASISYCTSHEGKYDRYGIGSGVLRYNSGVYCDPEVLGWKLTWAQPWAEFFRVLTNSSDLIAPDGIAWRKLLLRALPIIAALLVIVIRMGQLFRFLPLQGYCPRCGYNLVGNLSGICPECGNTIEPPHEAKAIPNGDNRLLETSLIKVAISMAVVVPALLLPWTVRRAVIDHALGTNLGDCERRFDEAIVTGMRAIKEQPPNIKAARNAWLIAISNRGNTTETRTLLRGINDYEATVDAECRGDEAMLRGDYADAFKAYGEAITLSPSASLETKGRKARAFLLLSQVRLNIQEGQFLIAARKVRESLWYYPTSCN